MFREFIRFTSNVRSLYWGKIHKIKNYAVQVLILLILTAQKVILFASMDEMSIQKTTKTIHGTCKNA